MMIVRREEFVTRGGKPERGEIRDGIITETAALRS